MFCLGNPPLARFAASVNQGSKPTSEAAQHRPDGSHLARSRTAQTGHSTGAKMPLRSFRTPAIRASCSISEERMTAERDEPDL